MNPKFNLGDKVYFRDYLFIVATTPTLTHRGWEYDLISKMDLYPSALDITESQILSVSEWNAKQQGSQNAVGLAAFNQAWRDKMEEANKDSWYSPVIGSPKCTCGAHKVKDARHSHWCDIK